MNMIKRRVANRGSYGFSLVELMVVIVILGLLAGLVGNNVIKYIARARVTTAKAQISKFHSAVNSYRIDTNEYPDNSIGLDALIEQPAGVDRWDPEGYLEAVSEIPVDPWGSPYQYQSPGEYSKFDIFSFGPDGREGGGDDIYNSDTNTDIDLEPSS